MHTGAPARMFTRARFVRHPVCPCGAAQNQYVQLQEMYQQLKAQKISELEGMLEEQVGVCPGVLGARGRSCSH